MQLINGARRDSVVIGAYRVIAEPCDVSLVATVKEYRPTWRPVRAVDEVPLEEGPVISKVEVVQLVGTHAHCGL